jgi:hypothetical protein
VDFEQYREHGVPQGWDWNDWRTRTVTTSAVS